MSLICTFRFRYTLDLTTALIFGQFVNGLLNGGLDSFPEDFSEAADITAYRGRLGVLHWAYGPARFIRLCKSIKYYVDGHVENALGSPEKNQECSGDADSQFSFIRELQKEL